METKRRANKAFARAKQLWIWAAALVFSYVDLGAGRSATALAAGRHHTCALLDDASIKCWGKNEHGQLGIPLTTSASRGLVASGMGSGLPAVPLGTGKTAVAVYAGGDVTCAILNDFLTVSAAATGSESPQARCCRELTVP